MEIKKNLKKRLYSILKHTFLTFIIVTIIALSAIVLGGNVIVKEGVLTAGNSLSSPQIIDSSLLTSWQFNGNSSVDSSQYGNVGNFKNGAHAMNDVLQLDGINDYFEIQNATSTQSPHITISAWFLLKSGNTQTIISKPINGPPWVSPYTSYLLRVNNLSRLETSVTAIDTYSSTGMNLNSSLLLNQWHHIVMTYNGFTITTYINNVKIGIDEFVTGDIGYNSSKPILIGADYGANPAGDYFNGSIDNVKIFSRALAEWEVRQLYEEQSKNKAHFNNIFIGDAEIFWNGNYLAFRTNNTNRTADAWFSRNISATGYITRTVAWNKAVHGNALDYIRNDYIDSATNEIDHDKYSSIEKASYEIVDYDNCRYENTGEIDSLTGQNKKVQVCDTKVEEGVLLDGSVAKHEQAIYELKQKIIELEEKIEVLENNL